MARWRVAGEALSQPAPAWAGAGCVIDVFTTGRNAGWPLTVVRGAEDPYHRYALVLVEEAASPTRPPTPRTAP